MSKEESQAAWQEEQDFLASAPSSLELAKRYGTGTPKDTTLWPEAWRTALKKMKTGLDYWDWVAKQLAARKKYQDSLVK